MLNIQVGVSGRDALQRRLDELKRKASRKNLEKALKAGGEVFKRSLEDHTPVRTEPAGDTALAPGQLKGDYHVTVDSNAAGPRVFVGAGPETKQTLAYLEFGHRHVGKDGKVSAHNTPALPIVRPSYETSLDEATQAVINSLQEDAEE